MTTNFEPANSVQQPHVISQTQVADVIAVGGYTKPSGVYLVILVPLKAWQSGAYDSYLQTPAQWIEQLLAGGIVTAAAWYQQTDSSTLLAGYVRLTVTYNPSDGSKGPFSGFVNVPMSILALADPFSAPMPGGTLDEQVKAEFDRQLALGGGPVSAKL
jgi:hypothetical protein